MSHYSPKYLRAFFNNSLFLRQYVEAIFPCSEGRNLCSLRENISASIYGSFAVSLYLNRINLRQDVVSLASFAPFGSIYVQDTLDLSAKYVESYKLRKLRQI